MIPTDELKRAKQNVLPKLKKFMKDLNAERKEYERMKREILEAVDTIEDAHPEAGKYLREHLVFDDEKMAFKYTGDDRLQLNPVIPKNN